MTIITVEELEKKLHEKYNNKLLYFRPTELLKEFFEKKKFIELNKKWDKKIKEYMNANKHMKLWNIEEFENPDLINSLNLERPNIGISSKIPKSLSFTSFLTITPNNC